MKRRLHPYVWILAGALMLGVSGCVVNLGNRATPDGTSLGKELMDLKEARDRGVISDSEYEEQRKAMLHRRGPEQDHDH